ncbi:MAG: DUF2125 domain-containing protein [Bauldia sp.]|nr:DUF2125 domain-containing protein [Bauldia sp.]
MVAAEDAPLPTAVEVPRRRRRAPRWLFGILILVILLWCAYWYAAYRVTDSVIGSAVDGRDPVVACTERAIGGFPFQLRLSCSAASVNGGEGAAFSIGPLAVAAALYNPTRINATIAAPLALDTPTFQLDATWDEADSTVAVGFSGVSSVEAAFEDVSVAVADGIGFPLWGVTADRWTTRIEPAPERDDALRAWLSTEALVVDLGGSLYPSLSGTATLTLMDTGGTLNADPAATARNWLRTGGSFHIDASRLTSGTVVAEITGPLVLELDGTFSGEVTVRYRGEEDLPMLISALFPGYANQADIIAEAIVVLSKTIEMEGQPAYEAKLILRHGAVNVGLIPILTIPSLGSLEGFLE